MKVRWRASGTAAENASNRLPGLVLDYFALGRELSAGEAASPADLHAFRLATKRLRYTLELFRECYGPGLEARLDELRSIQTLLGDGHDCAVAADLIGTLLPSGSEERQKIEQFLVQRAASKTEGFRKHWRSVFDASGRERAWVAYLSHNARAHHARAC